VALAAPLAGMLSDRYGRKRVIVPATLLLAVPTALAATSTTFSEFLFWRFWQGVFTPGIFAATVAYIAEEWTGGTGQAMSAYVTGTVLGGFCGRTLTALVAARYSWQAAFVLLGMLNLAGAAAIWAWLPEGKRRGAARSGARQWAAIAGHLHNSRLLAAYGTGFCVLFTLVAAFTYVNFYLAAPPFELGTAALGMLFVVYLAGAVITPFAGRSIDRFGHRAVVMIAFAGGIAGTLLTLVRSLPVILAGLALCCAAVFVAQSAANSYVAKVAGIGRAAAVGLYVTCYYAGGSFGAALPGPVWTAGGWPACAALIVFVQGLTILLAALFWDAAPAPRRILGPIAGSRPAPQLSSGAL
jgi:predicted MFS family arabinose efflux permease